MGVTSVHSSLFKAVKYFAFKDSFYGSIAYQKIKTRKILLSKY